MLESITDPLVTATDGGASAGVPRVLSTVSVAVDALLDGFLQARIRELTDVDPALEGLAREVADFVCAPGKRLRPAFVYWGYRATGAPHDDAILTAAAAMEMLQAFALIHDDIMDRSPERRGRPAVHKSMAATHRSDRLQGDHAWFGVGGGILAGDLAFVWADQLLDEAPVQPDALARARRIFTALRVEVTAGQYLDLRLAGKADACEDEALHIALLKSGRYTVTRPLQLGAAMGDGDEVLDAALRAFGDAVGLAFQLRDDVLGLFGDPSATGKGALEDLREGKRTFLMLRALERADAEGRAALTGALGNLDVTPAQAEAVRAVVVGCGALQDVERLIGAQQEQANRALVSLGEPARGALETLARVAAFRVV